MAESSVYKKVGIASLIMMASVFLSRAIGFIREIVIGGIGGATADVDAYQLAFIIPEILNHIVASGFLSITFIPIFSRYLAENNEDEGWKVFSIILTVFGGLLLIFIVFLVIFTPELVIFVAHGRHDPVFRKYVTHMTRIIIPAQFFFFTGGIFMAVQFAKEKFFFPALAPLVYNLFIILGGVVLGPKLGMEGFSWGVLSGAFMGNFALQYWGARKAGMKFAFSFNFIHPDLKTYIVLTLPLILGMGMAFSTEILFKFFGAYQPAGSIASLNYGIRIMQVLAGFFGQALGVAIYPFMARFAAEKNFMKMNELLNTTLRYLSVVIPFSVLFIVLRHEIVLMLFQRGKFDAAATSITSGVLGYFMIGAFGFTVQTVVVRGYYAMQDTLFPAIYTTVAVLLSIPAYVYGMQVMGVNGVALAVSLSAIFQVVLLYVLWNRRSSNTGSRSVYLFYLKIVLLSIPLGLVLEWIRQAAFSGINASSFSGSLIIAAVIAAVFMCLLGAFGYLFRIKEFSELIRRTAEKTGSIFHKHFS